jgi:hypothetical protein
MKITVKKLVSEAIELPQYFQVGTQKFKISNDQNWFTRISGFEDTDLDFGVFPKITIDLIKYLNIWVDGSFIPISSNVFHAELFKVVTEIEKLAEL